MSKETQKRKPDRPRKFGDRKDGWRVRKMDPYMNIVPVLMLAEMFPAYISVKLLMLQTWLIL